MRRIRAAARFAICAGALLIGVTAPLGAQSDEPRRGVAAWYAQVVAAMGGTLPDRLEKRGVVTAGGLSGSIFCRQNGANQFCDTQLGPLSERMQRQDASFYRRDVSGFVRKLNGTVLRHERTESAIEDFSFLNHPEWAVFEPIHDSTKLAVRLVVPGGDAERVIFDRATKLVAEIASTNEDGPQRVHFQQYRPAGGVTLPFHIVIERGTEQRYDLQFTSMIVNPQFADDAFALPRSRQVVAPEIQTVPMTLRDDHWYVPVMLGKRTYSFLVDTGSQTIVVDSRTAREIGLAPAGNFLIRGAKDVSGTGLATLADLRIGAAQFGPQMAVVTDLGTTTDGTAHIDGIIGFPIFAQAAVEMDPRQAKLRIGEPGSMNLAGDHAQISLDRGIIEVRAELKNGPPHSWLILDTGSSDAIEIYEPFSKRYPYLIHIGEVTERTYGVGGSAASSSADIARVAIAGLGTYDHVASLLLHTSEGAFADPLVAGNVGMGLLGKAVLGFDLQNGIVSFGFQNGTAARP